MARIVRHNDESVREGWKYKRNLESLRGSSTGFGNDSKMMVMSADVTAQVAPELQRQMRTGIWQLLPKERDGAHRQTCLVSSLQLPACQMCSTYSKSLSPEINLSREHALWTPQQWSCVMFSDESMFSLQSDSRQVPVTTKRRPLNYTVTVVQDGSFAEELFLIPELTCMF
ncbi:HTH_Tnp_Tc3_2 domain-containing protein [Trichonephila clavipes]|nr:HTH_Tnp_Tc3_2 domain-containing protein [Trichonephila clavipes]